MKLLYKPFAIIGRLIAARIGRSAFRSIWASIDEGPPPSPGSGQGSVAKVVGGQALQAAVMAGVSATVDRAFASTFHYLIGAWPEKPPKPDDD
jgi:hypothetical protein